MAMQPSTREDEQVDDAAADVGKGPKPVLVSDENPEEAGERSAEASKPLNRYERADIGPGMKPILYHEKTTENSLRRNIKTAEQDLSPREILRRIKRILGSEKTEEEPSQSSAEASKPLNRYERADIGPGMQPILYHEKTTEDSLKRNLKPPEKRDKTPIAERFSSWLRQRRDRRADP